MVIYVGDDEMAWNIPQAPNTKLTAQDMGTPDYAKSLREGFQTAYAPQMLQAQVEKLKADAIKNKMLGQLFASVLGGGNNVSESGTVGGDQITQQPQSSGLGITKEELARNLLGLSAQSPEQKQAMELKTNLTKLGQRSEFQTGPANEAREVLQNEVSMPAEYSGMAGSANMAADLLNYNLYKNKDAGKRLVQAALAQKLAPEYAGFQLTSQGVKATVPALQHQTEAIKQGWPLATKYITGSLPHELQKEAERLHNLAVKNVNKVREEFNVRGGRTSPSSNINNNPITWDDIQHTAATSGHSETEVLINLAKKRGMSVPDFVETIGGKP